jgi:hypothetical protein
LGYKFFFKELILIKGFLNSIFFILNKLKNICYKFFFLSNKNITSRWLCRYIGIKLKNNYSFYSVVNPVKKELHKLCKLNKRKNFNKILKFKNLIKVNSIDYKLKFKNLIKNFFLIYTKENYLYYMGNNNYIYDIFIFFFYKKKINKYMKLYEFLKLYKYIYINIFINYY